MTIYQKIANIQDKILNIPKDGKNPHFSNTYATYEQVMEVLHPYLREQKLMICHGFGGIVDGVIGVMTKVVDLEAKEKNDEFIAETLFIPMTKNDPQMAGSAITYAKRYTVLAMLGLGTEDDDGEKATSLPKPTPKDSGVDDLTATCRIHGDPLIQATSKKTGNPYWSHRMPNGDICFGK